MSPSASSKFTRNFRKKFENFENSDNFEYFFENLRKMFRNFRKQWIPTPDCQIDPSLLIYKGPLHRTARAGHKIPNSAGGTSESCSEVIGSLTARIARPASLAIWHPGHSHRRPSQSPDRKHFAALDLEKPADFSLRRPTSQDLVGVFVALFLWVQDI